LSHYPFLTWQRSLLSLFPEKVTKDQQTWRKEFKQDGTQVEPSIPVTTAKPKLQKKTPLKGLPIFEYQDRGFKWVVENHTKESVIGASPDGILAIKITDPKQQVYMYNCDDITLKIEGKFKSLVLDQCTKANVVFDTLISSTEVVNSKRVQLQVNGLCPVFTIDKTQIISVFLSKECVDISSFTTSLSSEMNVSFPDGDEWKELPIPEQFVHKLKDNKLDTHVSDLYSH
jgi:adenylyl cyclase-associated protein